jgi:non-ribosomal peptide synthetase component F
VCGEEGTDGGLAEEVAEKALQRACAQDGSARIVDINLACVVHWWWWWSATVVTIAAIAIAIAHVWCWQTATHTTFECVHILCSALAHLCATSRSISRVVRPGYE